MVAKRRPFMGLFIFGNKKMSHGAMSGEYGGCGIIRMLLFFKIQEQAMPREQFHYRGAKAMNCFFHKFHDMNQSICQHHRRIL